MPIYDYQCRECSQLREVIQKRSDSAPIQCLSCQQCNCMIKLISPCGIQFKGEGWYVTDYSNKFKKPENEASTDEKVEKILKNSPKESTIKKKNE